MEPQQPAVGRWVHYVSRGSADGIFPKVCRAAVITEVVEVDGLQRVGLAVHNPDGIFFGHFVEHREPTNDDEELVGGTWHWPEWIYS
jgi:hypothetical protein